ncbi:MAG: hypothetical protein CM1200mP18_15480 [Gammaproteobacteria bacterium]|nr:MAG: hypothetical protein CM1200mP18_15480 [Gammaproteobacteria bacterium]
MRKSINTGTQILQTTGLARKRFLDQFLEPWARLLVGAAQLSGGEQIADIGCGTGATTIKFAASVGTGGRVTGIDLSRKLIDSAISSARERAIENVMFVEADAAGYHFPCPQDLIVSRCGVMFFGDLVAAFSHLRSGFGKGRPDITCCLAGARTKRVVSVSSALCCGFFLIKNLNTIQMCQVHSHSQTHQKLNKFLYQQDSETSSCGQ